MAEHGKRYQDASKLVDRTRVYPVAEAMTLAKETSGVTTSASPGPTSWRAPETVATALPDSATNTSSRVSACSGLAAPGANRRRQAEISRDPRLGDARPVTKVPPASKVGAVEEEITVMRLEYVKHA